MARGAGENSGNSQFEFTDLCVAMLWHSTYSKHSLISGVAIIKGKKVQQNGGARTITPVACPYSGVAKVDLFSF